MYYITMHLQWKWCVWATIGWWELRNDGRSYGSKDGTCVAGQPRQFLEVCYSRKPDCQWSLAYSHLVRAVKTLSSKLKPTWVHPSLIIVYHYHIQMHVNHRVIHFVFISCFNKYMWWKTDRYNNDDLIVKRRRKSTRCYRYLDLNFET